MWDRLEDFDEYTTTLSTCNEMNPAQNDPGNFQVDEKRKKRQPLEKSVLSSMRLIQSSLFHTYLLSAPAFSYWQLLETVSPKEFAQSTGCLSSRFFFIF